MKRHARIRPFTNWNLQKKFIIVFICLISVPITVLSYISYRNYSGTIKDHTEDYVEQVAQKMVDNLDTYYTSLKRVSILPIMSEQPQQTLGAAGNAYENQRFLEVFAQNLNYVVQYSSTVYLVDASGRVYYNRKGEMLRSGLSEYVKDWKRLATEADGAPVLIGTHPITTTSGKEKYVFSMLRLLKSSDTMEPIGMIVIDTQIDYLQRSVEQLDSVTKGKTIVLDENFRVMYDSNEQWLARDMADHALVGPAIGAEGSFEVTWDGGAYICSYSESAETGWKVLVYTPVKELTASAERNLKVQIASTLAITGFALIISILLTIALTRPLKRIIRLMSEVKKGNLDVRFPVRYEDEIGMLGSQFNLMLDHIKDLIQEVYQIQKRKREADIHVLQSQINPHFIYNTLETIRMMAEINDDERVSGVTAMLGQLLRYSIVRGNERVTVRDEINHLENYMYLQNVRFKERFRLDVDIPEDMMRANTLKLIFQPIVENAIYHGLERSDAGGTIRITGLQEQQKLVFRICDDGAGMDADTLKRLNDRLVRGVTYGEGKHGIGLSNVNERIQLQYGPAYGLKVSSTMGGGTCVTMSLPAEMEVSGE